MPPAVTFRRKVDQTMPFRHPSIHEFQSEYGVDLSDDLPDSASVRKQTETKNRIDEEIWLGTQKRVAERSSG